MGVFRVFEIVQMVPNRANHYGLIHGFQQLTLFTKSFIIDP